jgi:hypothetical protein
MSLAQVMIIFLPIVSGGLKLLSEGRVQNVSVALSVFFLKM